MSQRSGLATADAADAAEFSRLYGQLGDLQLENDVEGSESLSSESSEDDDDDDDDDEDDDDNDVEGSEEETSWINWFCSLRENAFLCEVDEDYIEDDFNLTGLSTFVPYYEYALDVILDIETPNDESMSQIQQEMIESAAEMLYGLIHARYILTTKGMAAMLDKYQNVDFGRCHRVYCQGQPVLPVGQSDVPRHTTVNVFCPKCRDIFFPKPQRAGRTCLSGSVVWGTMWATLWVGRYVAHSILCVFMACRDRRRVLWRDVPARVPDDARAARAAAAHASVRPARLRLQGAQLERVLYGQEEGRRTLQQHEQRDGHCCCYRRSWGRRERERECECECECECGRRQAAQGERPSDEDVAAREISRQAVNQTRRKRSAFVRLLVSTGDALAVARCGSRGCRSLSLSCVLCRSFPVVRRSSRSRSERQDRVDFDRHFPLSRPEHVRRQDERALALDQVLLQERARGSSCLPCCVGYQLVHDRWRQHPEHATKRSRRRRSKRVTCCRGRYIRNRICRFA